MQIEEEKDNFENVELTQPSTSGGSAKQASIFSSKITNFLRKPMNEKKTSEIHHIIVELIVKDFLPIHIVDSLNFKKMCKALNQDYNLPTRKTVSEVLIP